MKDFWIEDLPVWQRWVIIIPFIAAAFFAVFDTGVLLIETGPWG